MATARKLKVVLLLLTTCVTGCSMMAPQPVREINYSVLKLGTPAIVVNEAGKSQVVKVLVPMPNGEMIPGKLDSVGMMLLDKPTYDVYREAWQKAQAKPSASAEEVERAEEPPGVVRRSSL